MDAQLTAFMLLLFIGLIMLIVLGIALFYVYKIEREENDKLKVFRPSLTWSRESGFNRAPTIFEAEQFKVNEAGDVIRRQMLERDYLEQTLNAQDTSKDTPTKG